YTPLFRSGDAAHERRQTPIPVSVAGIRRHRADAGHAHPELPRSLQRSRDLDVIERNAARTRLARRLAKQSAGRTRRLFRPWHGATAAALDISERQPERRRDLTGVGMM